MSEAVYMWIPVEVPKVRPCQVVPMDLAKVPLCQGERFRTDEYGVIG